MKQKGEVGGGIVSVPPSEIGSYVFYMFVITLNMMYCAVYKFSILCGLLIVFQFSNA